MENSSAREAWKLIHLLQGPLSVLSSTGNFHHIVYSIVILTIAKSNQFQNRHTRNKVVGCKLNFDVSFPLRCHSRVAHPWTYPTRFPTYRRGKQRQFSSRRSPVGQSKQTRSENVKRAAAVLKDQLPRNSNSLQIYNTLIIHHVYTNAKAEN